MNHAFQPFSIGEITDRSINIAVRQWRTLSVLVLLEAVPAGVLRALLPASGRTSLVVFALDIFVVSLLYPAAVFTTIAADETPTRPMLQAAAPRYRASFATIVVSLSWVIFWLSLATVAGVLTMVPFLAAQQPANATIAGVVVAVAVGLALLPRAGLIAAMMLPILIVERVTVWDAFARARRRVNHAGFVRSSLLGLAICAVTVAPTLALGSAFDALVTVTHLTALEALDELVSDAISLGVGVVLNTVVALEMRARYEGADLEAELDASVR